MGRKIIKILGIAALILIVMVVAIRLVLPIVAIKIANKKLPELLNTGASIGGVRLRLYRGYLSFHDLRIAQPEGFGEGVMLSVPQVSVKVKLASLLNPPLIVEEVALNGAVINIVKNKDGHLNTEALSPETLPAPSPSPEGAGEPPKEEKESATKPILISKVAVNTLAFSYTDYSFKAPDEGFGNDSEDEPGAERVEGEEKNAAGAREIDADEILRVQVADFNLLITDLLIAPAADPVAIEPATVLITARIVQRPFTDALLGIEARVGPVGAGIPYLNAVLRLGDLELEPISVVVPAGTTEALGGTALDLSADLALSPEVLDCEIEVEAAGGHTFSLSIAGTPEKPEIDTSGILFTLLLHAGGGVGALMGNVAGAGVELAAGSGETAAAVGEGVAEVVGSIAAGLFGAVTSAAIGDLDGTVEGLSDAIVGSAGEVAEAAVDVSGEIGEGASATVDVTTGGDADRAWRAATEKRWMKAWKKARKLLAEMPYPPLPSVPRATREEVGSPHRPEKGKKRPARDRWSRRNP